MATARRVGLRGGALAGAAVSATGEAPSAKPAPVLVSDARKERRLRGMLERGTQDPYATRRAMGSPDTSPFSTAAQIRLGGFPSIVLVPGNLSLSSALLRGENDYENEKRERFSAAAKA